MVMYYCENCCTIHQEPLVCCVCGEKVIQPIVINVQYQKTDHVDGYA
ncbi:hypothetical protein OEV98_08820 [Caldibacillus lycopersici]|uniref:Uncharacterized protein n=1 Tax=Perspicuibacillus lycopersici TaxID=1325689 RepID=A0AAE3LNA8_9BACI|nr:hypothetical protein [Perspicuibacillus lycopersici]MCU9613662.1 hypothetical protein [Perspicuibacillus lycopersici]